MEIGMSSDFRYNLSYHREHWQHPVEERVNGAPGRAYLPYQVLSSALYKLSMGDEREAMVLIIPDRGSQKAD